MLEFFVNNQTVRMYTPVIAADTLHFLTGAVHFTDETWDGYTKWIHFAQGEGSGATVYDVALTDDAWTEAAELNLTVGEWSVYLTGTKGTARLTTTPLILTVKASGLIDAPLHVMPLSVAEQIDSKAATALSYAQTVKTAYDNGELNGADGKSFVIGGFYDTYADLVDDVPDPAPGEAYGVGTTIPYDIYIWDEINHAWKNNGPVQGAKGDKGDTGTTFTPSVDAGGNLSWTNDGGKENPAMRNIKGDKGDDGDPGPAGTSAYEAAQEGGYTGTEATFNAALAAVPYHNARHLPGGADPILVKTGNIETGAVTKEKIGTDAVSTLYTAEIGTTWTGTDATETQYLSPDGTETDFTIDAAPASITQVKVLATGTVLEEGTDYTYSSGTLSFTTPPASGTNAIEVTYPIVIAPYTQSVSVSGLASTDKVLVDVDLPSTISSAEAILDAFANIYKISVANDSLTVYAFERTSTAIPITVLAVSK